LLAQAALPASPDLLGFRIMRVPMTWLRSHCDPPLPADELAARLALSTAEVERIDRVGVGDPERFVVGKVLTAEQHPNADRLTVCTVDAGEAAPRTIVCGAPNVAAGQTVAVALPGAVMPDGQKLGEAKLRGIKSSGMILAEDEVGVGEGHDGIMVLPDALTAGAPLQEALAVHDLVLELEVNPNRPDLLSVYGVAREVHALTREPLGPDPTVKDAEPDGDDRAEHHVSIEIDPEICLRFTARVFEDVRIGPSPLWLKQRLIAAGQRPISNVVDITNYVMLMTGQPLHAFDLDKVRGQAIIVRRANEGERMTTLDDTDRELDPSIAVVADAEGPSGIAGIMGGQISEVSDQTARVLMEAATWVGPNIMRSEARLGLRTEASTRFEKQLHPELAMAAQRLAARLMVELCDARFVPGTIDVYPQPLEPRVVRFRTERAARLLGVEVPDEEIEAILDSLGFAVAPVVDGVYDVTVPYWRDGDVQREADLIEEVGRIHGLDKVPATLPERAHAVGRLNPSQRLRRRLEDELRGRGLSEIIAYSFTRPEALQALRVGDVPALRVANPLSEEQSLMRPLLLPGLLDAAARNAAHGRPDVRLFESAHVYRQMADGRWQMADGASPRGRTPASERHHIGALITQAAPATWRSPARPADFYAAKALVEALLAPTGVDWWVDPEERPYLHPGRSATIYAGDDERKLGWVGELHPLVERAWDVQGVAAFEIDVDVLVELDPGPALAVDLTTFPALLQDLAVVVQEDVPAADVERLVRLAGGDLLRSARVFDVYRGEQVGPDSKSLALRLEFRADDRTLTDADIGERRAAIETKLEEIGGRLRA
jgi:phenylalanyl-tRNA synthetase beta chain